MVFQPPRLAHRHEFCIRERLGEAIHGGRYQRLEYSSGRGRKPIMDSSDEESVRRAIEQDRQCVSKAKAAWEEATGKEASDATFKRFYQHWRKI